MLGFGALRQMNDSIKHNRDLLGKKKSALERQKEEIRIRSSGYENADMDYVKARVDARLKRNRPKEIVSATFVVIVLIGAVGGCIWVAFSVANLSMTEEPSSHYFNTVEYRQPNGLVLRTDYFIGGPKAAETTMKNGMKHQSSDSYYPSGEQFRSALYYYDTLVREVYLFKNGDTIKNFPAIPDSVVAHITLRHTKTERKIQFDIIDNKIIPSTYHETRIMK